MAKVDLGNIAPDAFPRIRGRFLVRPQRGGFIAVAWPQKRGENQSANSQWTAQQFAYAGRMAANAHTLDLQTAIYMTKGTDWVPRDLLMRGIFGTAYTIINQDGTEWTVTPKTPPTYRRPVITQWQFNQFDSAYTGTVSSSPNAFKGCIFVPYESMTIYAAQALFPGVINATYQMMLAGLSPTNVIEDLVMSDVVTAGATTDRFRLFNMPTHLLAGGRYALMVGRTDAGDAYAMPVRASNNARWLMPVNSIGFATLADATPDVGDTIANISAVVPPMGLLAAF